MTSIYYLFLLVVTIGGILWWAELASMRRERKNLEEPDRLERLRAITRKDLK